MTVQGNFGIDTRNDSGNTLVGFAKRNMKNTMVNFNNYILYYEIKIDEEIIECNQECIYLGQKIGTNLDHGKLEGTKNCW